MNNQPRFNYHVERVYRFLCRDCGLKKETPYQLPACPECGAKPVQAKPRDDKWRIRVDRSN